MVRRPRVVTRKETQRRSDSSQKRWLCRLGRKRRRLRLFACETVLPVFGRFPVTWQTRDMAVIPKGPQKRAGFYTREALQAPTCTKRHDRADQTRPGSCADARGVTGNTLRY